MANKINVVAEEAIGTPSQASIDGFLNNIEAWCDDSTKAILNDIDLLTKKINELNERKKKLIEDMKNYVKEHANKLKKEIKEKFQKEIDEINEKLKKYEKKLLELKKKVEKRLKEFFPGQLEAVIKKMGPPISVLYDIFQNGLTADLTKIKDALTSVIEYLVQPYIRYIKLAQWWGTNGPKMTKYTVSELQKITTALEEISQLKSSLAELASL